MMLVDHKNKRFIDEMFHPMKRRDNPMTVEDKRQLNKYVHRVSQIVPLRENPTADLFRRMTSIRWDYNRIDPKDEKLLKATKISKDFDRRQI